MKNPFKRGAKRYIKNLGVEYTGAFIEGTGIGFLGNAAIYGYRNQPALCKMYGIAGGTLWLIGIILEHLSAHEYDITMSKGNLNLEYFDELAKLEEAKQGLRE